METLANAIHRANTGDFSEEMPTLERFGGNAMAWATYCKEEWCGGETGTEIERIGPGITREIPQFSNMPPATKAFFDHQLEKIRIERSSTLKNTVETRVRQINEDYPPTRTRTFRSFLTHSHNPQHAHALERILSTCERYSTATISNNWKADKISTLVLASKACGIGKTHMAYAIMVDCAKAGLDVQFFPINTLFQKLRPSEDFGKMRAYTLERCTKPNVLVIDDVGTHKGTTFQIEQLFDILNWRWENKMTTILTTNAHANDQETLLCNMIKGTSCTEHADRQQALRVASRISQSVVLEFDSTLPDWRRSK